MTTTNETPDTGTSTPDVMTRLKELRETYSKQRNSYKLGSPLDRFFDGMCDALTIAMQEIKRAAPKGTPDVEALIGRIGSIKYGHTLGENHIPIFVEAIITLRQQQAEIEDLRGEIEQARAEGARAVADVVTGILRSEGLHNSRAGKRILAPFDHVPPSPTEGAIRADAAKTERERIVAELRAHAHRHGADLYDQNYFSFAADHLEANEVGED